MKGLIDHGYCLATGLGKLDIELCLHASGSIVLAVQFGQVLLTLATGVN